MFSALDREQTDDDEVWYFASSDVEESWEQAGTCSQEGVVVHLNSFRSAILTRWYRAGTCSAGEVPQKRSGVSRSAGCFCVPEQLLCVLRTWCVMLDNTSAAFEQVRT
eukprot:4110954-Amphidinium_carterae.1